MSAKRKEPARYFSHDSNARNSDKLIRLRMRHGAAGYGVFFMILERLREEEDYMSVKDYNMIAFDLRVDASLIKSVVEDFGLFAFTENGKCFYSESFSQRMAVKDEKTKARSQAGKAAMEKRYSNTITKLPESGSNATKNDSNVITKPPESDNNKNKIKENKKKSPDGDKEKPPSPPLSRFEDFLAEALGSPIWLEAIAKNLQTDVEAVCALLKGDFRDHCIRDGKCHRDITDFKSHFNRWTSQLKYSSPQNETFPTASNLRHNDSAETRQQEFNRHIIAKLAAPDRTEPDISGNY